MHKIGNLWLIGTSHISPESVKEVRKVILENHADIVALELDKGRFLSLMGKKSKIRVRDIRRVGVKGFLFMLLGAWVEEQLGKVVKTKPGAEMKSAVKAAANIKAKIALVDQDINITLKRLFKEITWKEKFRFVWDIIKGVVFRQQEVKGFDLRKVPSEDMIAKLVDRVKDRYPSIYKTLIHERNVVMSRKLLKMMKMEEDKKIVAVVGAGHVRGMMKIIKNKI